MPDDIFCAPAATDDHDELRVVYEAGDKTLAVAIFPDDTEDCDATEVITIGVLRAVALRDFLIKHYSLELFPLE